MRWRGVVVALLALLVWASAAAHAQDRAATIAAALEREPVYVAPARAEQLGEGARGALQLRIVRRDLGRIKIAVVPGSWAPGPDGVRQLANEVDAALAARGALLVVADEAAHVVTSHPETEEAMNGVQRAFARRDGLEARLRRAVDALAATDPGPNADLPRPGAAGEGVPPGMPGVDFSAGEDLVDTINDTIRWTFFLVWGFVIAVFLLVGYLVFRRIRRAGALSEEALADGRAALEAERAELGEDIVDLDVATAMPDVPAAARGDFERALDAYEKSELALHRATTTRRLEGARQLIADGRRAAAAARAALG